MLTVVFVMAICAALGTMFISFDQRRRAERTAEAEDRARSAVTALALLVTDAEAARCGLAVDGDQLFRTRLADDLNVIPHRERELEGSVAHDPVKITLVRQINLYLSEYLRNYLSPALAASRSGGRAVPDAIMLAARRHADLVRSYLDRLLELVTRSTVAARARAETHSNAGILAGVVLPLFSVVALVLMRRRATAVASSVRRLETAAGQVADGELDIRVREDGPAETGRCQRVFNDMVSALAQRRHSLNEKVAEQSALCGAATMAAGGQPPEAVFDAVTEQAGTLFRADLADLLHFERDGTASIAATWSHAQWDLSAAERVRLEPEGMAAQVLQSGRAVCLTRPGAPAPAWQRPAHFGLQVAIGMPVIVAGRAWGVLRLMSRRREALPEDVMSRAAPFTDLVAIAVADHQARTDVAEARARIMFAADETRRTIERKLHNGPQQRLMASLWALQALDAQIPANLTELHTQVSVLTARMSGALDDLASIARDVHPAILSQRGLPSAVRSLARRSQVPVETSLDLPERLDERVETGTYHMVAEALALANEHPHTTLVNIEASGRSGRLLLHIEINGMPTGDAASGPGLVGIRDRVEALGGATTIESSPERDIRLFIDVPFATR
ncbi:GAF domain-containing protein [Dactylosporangium sucinum]|uniref:GAF domain-containing protein n=1 Tax=Dactylosporangium sucinum TaxID=1424081 RepID=UPI00167DADDD|nr:GAF domain-containing protein [Dactylosporangium sucinum]